MANWLKEGLHITSWGQSLINRSSLGDGRIEITKVLTGNRLFKEDNITPENATKLMDSSVKHLCSVYGWYPTTETGDTAFVIEVQLDNTKNWYNVATGESDITPVSSYLLRQLGVYARLVDTTGEELIPEQLFLVSECEGDPDEIPLVEDGEGGLLLNLAIQLNLFKLTEDDEKKIYVSMTNAGVLTQVQYQKYLSDDLALLNTKNKDKYSKAINEVKEVTDNLVSYAINTTTLTGNEPKGTFQYIIDTTLEVPDGLISEATPLEDLYQYLGEIVISNGDGTVQNIKLNPEVPLSRIDKSAIDYTPIKGSENLITSDAVAAIKSLKWLGFILSTTKDKDGNILGLDLDNYKGFDNIGYWSYSSGSDVSHAPIGRDANEIVTLLVEGIITSTSDYQKCYKQTIFYPNQGLTYVRYCNSDDEWSDWKRVVTLANTQVNAFVANSLNRGSKNVPKINSYGEIVASDVPIDSLDVRYRGVWTAGKALSSITSDDAGIWRITKGFEPSDLTTTNGLLARTSNEEILLTVTYTVKGTDNNLMAKLQYAAQQATFVAYKGWNGTEYAWSDWSRVVELPNTQRSLTIPTSTTISGDKVLKLNGDRTVSESDVVISNINTQNGNGLYFPNPDVINFTESGWEYTKDENGIRDKGHCLMSTMCCWNGMEGFFPYSSNILEYVKNLMPPPFFCGDDDTCYGFTENAFNLLNLGYKDPELKMCYTRIFDPVDLTGFKTSSTGDYVWNTVSDMYCSLGMLQGFEHVDYSTSSGVYEINKQYSLTFEIAQDNNTEDKNLLSLFGGAIRVRCKGNKVGLLVWYNERGNPFYSRLSFTLGYERQKFVFNIIATSTTETVVSLINCSTGEVLSTILQYSFGKVTNADCKLIIPKGIKFYGVGEYSTSADTRLGTLDTTVFTNLTYSTKQGLYNKLILSHFIPNQGVLSQLTPNWFEKEQVHKVSPILDHPDGSVTTKKIKDGNVISDKLSNTVNQGLHYYAICNTSGEVRNKVIEIPNIVLVDGVRITVKFTNAHTHTYDDGNHPVTLDVIGENSEIAKGEITYYGRPVKGNFKYIEDKAHEIGPIQYNTWKDGEEVELIYSRVNGKNYWESSITRHRLDRNNINIGLSAQSYADQSESIGEFEPYYREFDVRLLTPLNLMDYTCSSVDATEEFQSAINNVSPENGIINIFAGTYGICSTLYIPSYGTGVTHRYNGITFQGKGESTVLYFQDYGGIALKRKYDNPKKLIFKDLVIKCDDTVNESIINVFSSLSDCELVFENVIFDLVDPLDKRGTTNTGTSPLMASTITMKNCKFTLELTESDVSWYKQYLCFPCLQCNTLKIEDSSINIVNNLTQSGSTLELNFVYNSFSGTNLIESYIKDSTINLSGTGKINLVNGGVNIFNCTIDLGDYGNISHYSSSPTGNKDILNSCTITYTKSMYLNFGKISGNTITNTVNEGANESSSKMIIISSSIISENHFYGSADMQFDTDECIMANNYFEYPQDYTSFGNDCLHSSNLYIKVATLL